MSFSLKDFADLTDEISKRIPAPAADVVEVVSLVVRVADKALMLTGAELDDVKMVARREIAAGQSISKASHLAGLRDELQRIIRSHDSVASALDAIMAEVARRMP